jgi:hypothetical protein
MLAQECLLNQSDTPTFSLVYRTWPKQLFALKLPASLGLALGSRIAAPMDAYWYDPFFAGDTCELQHFELQGG